MGGGSLREAVARGDGDCGLSTFLYTNTTQERRMVLKFRCRKNLRGLMS